MWVVDSAQVSPPNWFRWFLFLKQIVCKGNACWVGWGTNFGLVLFCLTRPRLSRVFKFGPLIVQNVRLRPCVVGMRMFVFKPLLPVVMSDVSRLFYGLDCRKIEMRAGPDLNFQNPRFAATRDNHSVCYALFTIDFLILAPRIMYCCHGQRTGFESYKISFRKGAATKCRSTSSIKLRGKVDFYFPLEKWSF